MSGFTHRRLSLVTRGQQVDLAIAHRPGLGVPVLFLHGFGSTRNDWAPAADHPGFAGHQLLAYDAPGFGQSTATDLSAVDIGFLVDTARAVLAHHGITRFHLVGHSMGGLTALQLAAADPTRVVTFTDVEGNLAPEDCFLSRQIHDHPEQDPALFLQRFSERVAASADPAAPAFAAGLAHAVDPRVVRSVFTSMVDLSDHGNLLDRYLALPLPRQFVHGEDNAHLSYLPQLAHAGVEVVSVPRAGHWPMTSNPTQFWNQLGVFIESADTAQAGRAHRVDRAG